MRVRLDMLADRAHVDTLRAFRGLNPAEFAAAWDAIALSVGGIYVATQVSALEVAGQYLSAVAETFVPVEAAPFVGTVGTTPLADWLDITPRAFTAKVAGGMTPVEAAVAQANYLAASTSAEAHVVGRDAVATTATSSPRFTSFARVPEPGACDFCRMLASRGAVYSEATATRRKNGMPYHTRRPDGSGGNCRCTARAMPVGTGEVAWDGRGAPTGKPAGRPRKTATPRPARPATAQQVAETKANYSPGAKTPERAAVVQRELAIYRENLAAGRATDWASRRVAALEAEAASL